MYDLSIQTVEPSQITNEKIEYEWKRNYLLGKNRNVHKIMGSY